MAPPQSITVIDPLPWPRSTVTAFALHELENGGQLAPNVDGQPTTWIVSVKNVTDCSALRFVIGRTSTHLENLSMATSRWV
jgi:hypothetical protein